MRRHRKRRKSSQRYACDTFKNPYTGEWGNAELIALFVHILLWENRHSLTDFEVNPTVVMDSDFLSRSNDSDCSRTLIHYKVEIKNQDQGSSTESETLFTLDIKSKQEDTLTNWELYFTTRDNYDAAMAAFNGRGVESILIADKVSIRSIKNINRPISIALEPWEWFQQENKLIHLFEAIADHQQPLPENKRGPSEKQLVTVQIKDDTHRLFILRRSKDHHYFLCHQRPNRTELTNWSKYIGNRDTAIECIEAILDDHAPNSQREIVEDQTLFKKRSRRRQRRMASYGSGDPVKSHANKAERRRGGNTHRSNSSSDTGSSVIATLSRTDDQSDLWKIKAAPQGARGKTPILRAFQQGEPIQPQVARDTSTNDGSSHESGGARPRRLTGVGILARIEEGVSTAQTSNDNNEESSSDESSSSNHCCSCFGRRSRRRVRQESAASSSDASSNNPAP